MLQALSSLELIVLYLFILCIFALTGYVVQYTEHTKCVKCSTKGHIHILCPGGALGLSPKCPQAGGKT